MTATILQGDVFEQLPTIKPGSVDCCVTSPPYWKLRSYLPKGHPLKHLELGNEKTPQEYIAKMVRVFQLVRECLADHATCWVNIGDTYFGDSPVRSKAAEAFSDTWDMSQTASRGGARRSAARIGGLQAGSLCLIPQRLAIALQDAGWIVRSYVIWHKPAPMPSSVSGWAWRRCRVKVSSDRGNRSVKVAENGNHRAVSSFKDNRSEAGRALSAEGNPEWEDCPGCKKCTPTGGYVLRKGSWRPTSSYEPILMLAKTGEYFCDGEPVKTALAATSAERYKGGPMTITGQFKGSPTDKRFQESGKKIDGDSLPQSANLRDVWRIAAEPLNEGHYAAFPTELVRKCLQAGTSAKGYCPTCGSPLVRVVESKAVPHPKPRAAGVRSEIDTNGGNQANGSASLAPEVETIGWRPSCKCPAKEPRPALVCDPFAGSGRTGVAAGWLGLNFIGVELNPAYVAMGERILREDAPLFA